jgi:hypothetical protein
MRGRLRSLELALLLCCFGCQRPKGEQPRPSQASAPRTLGPLLAPRLAGRLRPSEGELRQQHPRLPDTGEWRCAERDRVVWCAGGEPAAGVVAGPPDPAFRCGPRWGNQPPERVCIDEHPDYSDAYACAFEQERGVARVCRPSASNAELARLPAHALPACWLDRDCPAQRCERGVCGCSAASDCLAGRCEHGLCVEARP